MKHNESIGCTVTECKFHCQEDNYCTLNHIQVVTHTSYASSKECTDCGFCFNACPTKKEMRDIIEELIKFKEEKDNGDRED